MAPIDLCLPLLKYSYADSDTTSSNIDWTHFSAVNLCVLVQGDDISNGRLTLSIVDKTTHKETIDIARYVEMANDVRSSARQRGATIQTEHLPIFGITKEALLALRYRLQDGRARRIQLRLQTEAQCREVVHILQRRGLDFQEQRPRTGRPDTAPVRLDTPTTEARSRITQESSVNAIHSRVAQSPFQPPSMSFGSLGQQSPSHTQQNDTTKFSSGPLASPPERFGSVQAPRTYSPIQLSHSQPVASSPFPGLQSTSLSLGQTAMADTDKQFSSMSSLPAPQKAPGHVMASAFESNDRISMPAHLRSETQRAAVNSAYGVSPSSSDIPGRPETASSSLSQPPASRPITGDRSQARPVDNGTNTTSRSRPSSALELPPLPMPKSLKARPTSALQHGITAPAESEPQVVPTRSTLDGQDLLSQPRSTSEGMTFTSLDDAGHGSRNMVPKERVVEGSRTVAARNVSKSMPRISSLMDAPHEIEEAPDTNASASVPQNHDHSGKVAMSDQDVSLQRYAAQHPQVRDTALNKFMMDHLQDPAFTVLCADIENCWRRIALGL
ncbi:hypothetical protein SMMN14_01201 [Sphaerulina musiva]